MTTLSDPPKLLGADPRARLLDALDRRRPERSLPGECYTDPDLHQVDLDLMWARQWIFVGASAEIPEPGDYVTVEIGTSSVIVLRDDDEQVAAFRNVCRHRGARLVAEGSGSVGNLVCGYHRWTYGTDGALRHAPQMAPGTDLSCLGLRRVHVRDVCGLVFVCLAADAPDDMDAVAEVLAPYLAPHALTAAKVAAQVDMVEQGNWKLVMENNRECYHCEGGHPDLTCTFFPTWGLAEHEVPPRLRPAHDRYLMAEADLELACEQRGLPRVAVGELVERPVGFRIQREALDGAGESFSRDGSRLVGRLLGELDEPRLGRLTLHAQPNLWAHFMADHAVVFSVRPLGPDRTLVRTTWLVHGEAREGIDYDVDALTDVWRHTNEEDAEFVAMAQRGVADPAYEPGPYSEGERQVDAFVTWYADRMREEAAR